jgi:hypothetical protein
MRLRKIQFFALIGSVLGLGLVAASADDGHKHGEPLHGGKVAMTKEYHFEAVFTRDGLKLHPRTHEDKPIDASRLTGTATFYHPNSPKPWFEQKLIATPAKSGQETTSIEAKIDLSRVPASGAKVAFKVSGLPEAAEATATFSVPFALAASKELVVVEATKDDQKAIAAQKTCPVSKEDLDSMGGPWKVSRGDKSTFICCKSCLKKVQAEPDKYLGATTSATVTKSGHDHDH